VIDNYNNETGGGAVKLDAGGAGQNALLNGCHL